jgi:hypothetical protein
MTLRRINSRGIPLLLTCLLLILSGCEKRKIDLISFDMQKLTPNPVIDSVVPPNVAPSGVTEIVIQGRNFSADPADLAVYFNSVQATIRSSAADRITVNRPGIVGDSVTIKVVHKNAILPAKLSPYKLEAVFSVLDLVLPTQIVQALDLDRDENLYINTIDGSFNRLLLKFPPGGQASDMGLLRYTATDQKVGPGGYLYLFVGQMDVYRVPVDGVTPVKWAKIAKKPSTGDFDADGNLYTAGKKTDLFTIRTDGSSIAAGKYADYDIRCIRVFDGAVYNLSQYMGTDTVSVPKTAIWKNRILTADGQLGDNELVMNWALTGAYSGSIAYCITFSEDGDLFIGTDYADPILIMKQSGFIEPLYPTILFPTVYQMAWGNGHYLYANLRSSQEAKNIVRIDAGRSGAPYYGRN